MKDPILSDMQSYAAHLNAAYAEIEALRREVAGAREREKAYRAALDAIKHFWLNDPIAFGDEATPTSMAGRFADLARLCIDTLEAQEHANA